MTISVYTKKKVSVCRPIFNLIIIIIIINKVFIVPISNEIIRHCLHCLHARI